MHGSWCTHTCVLLTHSTHCTFPSITGMQSFVAAGTATTSSRDERLLRAAASKILSGARTILRAREKELRAEAQALRTSATKHATSTQASHGTQATQSPGLTEGAPDSPATALTVPAQKVCIA